MSPASGLATLSPMGSWNSDTAVRGRNWRIPWGGLCSYSLQQVCSLKLWAISASTDWISCEASAYTHQPCDSPNERGIVADRCLPSVPFVFLLKSPDSSPERSASLFPLPASTHLLGPRCPRLVVLWPATGTFPYHRARRGGLMIGPRHTRCPQSSSLANHLLSP
ncbi:hypothetical protein GQ53DRAFT_547444 [Thozetella sp. PMI_491]|nr:hypothetical protein GQ53DRAFT_547444 [Thozetella sp. PMI_491]